jgi:hypothetical protein
VVMLKVMLPSFLRKKTLNPGNSAAGVRGPRARRGFLHILQLFS